MDVPSSAPRVGYREAIAPAVVLLTVLTALTVGYTLAVCAVAAVIGPGPRADTLLSPSLAETFAGPAWFHGRPSAAIDGVSGGSNLGPTNPALAAVVARRVAAIREENPSHRGPIPGDLVTTSASGLDPHISPTSARLQVARVAAANGLAEDAVRGIVERVIEPRTWGLFGQPRVNVIRLNAAVRTLMAANPPAAGAR